MQINDDWAGGRQASSNAAAQTGIVSVAGIRLDPGKFVRPFKGIFCDDIFEFESDQLSQAVGSPPLHRPRPLKTARRREIARDLAAMDMRTIVARPHVLPLSSLARRYLPR